MSDHLDARATRAQQLHWEVEKLRSQGLDGAVVGKLLELAHLYEERARELLAARDTDGWIDLYAAITVRAEAGSRLEAYRLIRFGRDSASQLSSGRENVIEELGRLEEWVTGLKVVPSLSDFAREVPSAA